MDAHVRIVVLKDTALAIDRLINIDCLTQNVFDILPHAIS